MCETPSIKIDMKITFENKYFLMEIKETQPFLWLLKGNTSYPLPSSGGWPNEWHPALLPSGLLTPSSTVRSGLRWSIREFLGRSQTWEVKPLSKPFFWKTVAAESFM